MLEDIGVGYVALAHRIAVGLAHTASHGRVYMFLKVTCMLYKVFYRIVTEKFWISLKRVGWSGVVTALTSVPILPLEASRKLLTNLI